MDQSHQDEKPTCHKAGTQSHQVHRGSAGPANHQEHRKLNITEPAKIMVGAVAVVGAYGRRHRLHQQRHHRQAGSHSSSVAPSVRA
jgi:hypothetical protein